ncbi:hypothetical protein CEXT_409111 [Caerostris extrusa]|uniref:Uncharacterized protein n=1 Tax=Caerostris extrusa TaxID=172846 RepID=A0AAV4XYU4_CAEEX|nr:hypothetical protein CEXT_409111 [Caerostris extrusa]
MLHRTFPQATYLSVHPDPNAHPKTSSSFITKKNPAHIPAFPFLVMIQNTTGNRPSSVAQTKWNSTQNIRNRTKQRLPAGLSSENKSMPIKLADDFHRIRHKKEQKNMKENG